MKILIKKLLGKIGYQIKKKDNGFSFNPNIDWIKEFNIKTIFDIGANEGQFASYINQYFSNCRIYSFEPIHPCFLKLVELNKKIPQLVPLNFALGDENCYIDFFVNEFTPSSSFLKMEEEHILNFPITKDFTLEKMKVKTLDSIYNNLEINKEVLVKIDVQGFEEKVIKGGLKFFTDIPKIVIVEASIVKLYKNEASFEDLYDTFRNMGYRYRGNLYQLYSPAKGSILQVDAIFIKN